MNEAERLNRQVLVQWEKFLEPDHKYRIGILNNLANVLKDKGDVAGAAPLYQQAFDKSSSIFGPEALQTLEIMNNLAGVLDTLGRHGEAENLSRRALAGMEKHHGVGHPSVHKVRSNLGLCLMHMEKFEQAEDCLRRALVGQDSAPGPGHLDTLGTCKVLALTLCLKHRLGEDTIPTAKMMGELRGARSLNLRALQGFSEKLGAQHPQTQATANIEQLLNQLLGVVDVQ